MAENDDFLLAEYKLLQNLRAQGDAQVDKYVRTYLVIFTLLLGVIGVSLNAWKSMSMMSTFAGTAFLIGAFTLRHMLEHHISTVKYTRYLNALRGKLSGAIPDHDKFVLLPKDPDAPKYGKSGFEGRPIFLNGYTGLVALLTTFSLVSTVFFLLNGIRGRFFYISSVAVVTIPIAIGLLALGLTLGLIIKRFNKLNLPVK